MGVYKGIEIDLKPIDFERVGLFEMHNMYFNNSMSEKQIADLFGVTKQDVHKRRKELGINRMKCGFMYVLNPRFKDDKRYAIWEPTVAKEWKARVQKEKRMGKKVNMTAMPGFTKASKF